MERGRRALPLLIGVLLSVSAQAASGLIGGVVIDRDTNTPVRRAVVTLSTIESEPEEAVAWTDAQGRFAFGYLPPGLYQLRALKDGFQPASFGARNANRSPGTVSLSDGENRGQIVFELHHPGSISGHVLDEDGDPVAGANVQILAPRFQRGKRTLQSVGNAITDGQGRYRLHDLAAGRYAVMAAYAVQLAPKGQAEVAAGTLQQSFSLGFQYYPSTNRATAATLLHIQPGQETGGIDFHLNARPVVSLSGRVVLPPEADPNIPVQVTVSSEDGGIGFQMHTSTYGPDSRFVVDRLSEGTYDAIAQTAVHGKQYRGSQRISLSGVPPEVTIALQPGVELSGKVTVEGPDAPSHPPGFVQLSLAEQSPLRTRPPRASVQDGTFKIADVFPGVWDISAGPVAPGGYIKSMLLGDQDVLSEDMVVRQGGNARLNIVLSTRGAILEGDLDSAGLPSPASVLLMPDGKYRHVLSFHRITVTDEKGHFEMKGLTPGTYKIFAFDELDRNWIQDPQFLSPYEQLGKPVELKEGPNASVKLVVTKVRPENYQ